MVSLVETLSLWARVRNFPFLMDLAGSRHASNSKLEVRPVEVESRLKCKVNDDRIEAADGEVVVVLEVVVIKGAPRAWIDPLGIPDEDWGL